MNEPTVQTDASRSRDSKAELDAIARSLPTVSVSPVGASTGSVEDHLPTTRMPSIAPPLPPVRPPAPRISERAETTVKVVRAQVPEKQSAARASLHEGWVALRTRASLVTMRSTLGASFAVLGAALLLTSFVVGLFSITSHTDPSAITTAIVYARAAVSLGGMAIGYALLSGARGVLLVKTTKAQRKQRIA